MNKPPKSLDERLEFLPHSSESLLPIFKTYTPSLRNNDGQIEALVKLTEQNERRWQRVMRVLRDALDAGLKNTGESDKRQ
jgi:hypothetical protein